ncbi:MULTISPECIES: FAD-dependent oxidoreductase [unclassified Streptomyces]|uniref:FAD-dependent oxidoreductase n=1 Tax=unclassified Streptomyces TaxID=2593676 RepID=UPI001660EFD7|nr:MULTISPECIES: FAD-dependent oxidoreductase [unclassified Streptomyces]MBD0709030.1 ferredoxin-NADP reductase [Streptomyces sp. CBMA291]MBD0715398.1 ferredoxin-NADP reductase [Streptomyces sp. CBMA370]
MTYVITQTCCSDATCVAVCPVDCIHPTPAEPDFGTTEMLYVDPRACIDCGACADACPVDAILPADRLTGPLGDYEEINAAHYADRPAAPPVASPLFHPWGAPSFPRSLPADFAPLRVAVVGTGPAGMYAAEDLLLHTESEVTLIDRLPVAGGLLRYGVAPDHPATKGAGESLARFHSHPRVKLRLGVEVGRDVTPAELSAHHDAVVYAVGAPAERRLGIPGEDLPGSVSAASLVSWYNAHPETGPDAVRLPPAAERVVVVGNGNVALDIARVLLSDPAELARTDIADHALAALRGRPVREVVLLARRGPGHAAYTTSELLALKHLPGVDLVVDAHDPRTGAAVDAARTGEKAALLAGLARETVDWTAPPPADRRRIVLRFHSAPTGVLGEDSVRAVEVTGAGTPSGTGIGTGLLVRAIGYRGIPLPGLPFDETTGTVPHEGGRITGMPGSYVVGWIKRGPTGGIGANRTCAEETVGTLLADAIAGTLPTPSGTSRAFRALLRSRSGPLVDARGLAAIERTERARGRATGRPRVKLATVPELRAAARTSRWRTGG